MKSCNDRWCGAVKQMINEGMNNVRGGINYEFIQCHHKAIKKKMPLIRPYFVVFDKKDKSKIFACNGWIMGSEDPKEPNPNFTKKGTYYYFKRKIVIWSDCPKLNYGNSPSDCPYLMKHMTKYVQDMAKMFNGFRLDNAHSTPIHAAEYLAQKAREVNPDLIIMAELFTTKEKEISFVNRIGINLLIRELIWCGDFGKPSLDAQIHRFGGGFDHMLGSIEETKYDYLKEDDDITVKNMKYLLPSLPHSIIFDLTHDNETFLQKRNNLALNLSVMACNAFSSTAIGSTRGYDQLFPIQPSVVNEQRRYVYDDQFSNVVDSEEPNLFKAKNAKKKEKKSKKEEPKEIMTTFRYRGDANSVDVALSSHNWQPDVHLHKDGDEFVTEIPIENHTKVYYKYVVDGNWICDNSQPTEDDGKGNVNNVINLLGNNNENNDDDDVKIGQRSFHTKDLKFLRRELNRARNNISKFHNEFYLHTENQYICVFRTFVVDNNYLENMPNYDGYALICRTGYDMGGTSPARIELPGIYCDFVCGCSMKIGNIDVEGFKKRHDLYGTDSDVYFTRDGSYLKGLCNIGQENGRSVMYFNGNVQPNTAIVVKFKLADDVRNSLVNVQKCINNLRNDWK